jgi:glycosyltransferase involved in cell wall biosynthesis
VVVTDVGSISEIVDDNKTGFIVPPRDSQALAEAVIRLLKDKKLRKEMGENAYKKLKEDFSWDRITEKTLEVYREAIANAKKAS